MENLPVGINPNLSQEEQQFVADAVEIGLAMQPRFSAEPALAKGKPIFKPATPEVSQRIDDALTAVIERARLRKLSKKAT
jgi:hypothetical protein